MSFNPDTDANWQNYKTYRAKLSGPDAAEFDQHLIQYLIAQATAGSLASTHITTTSNAFDNAKTSVQQRKRTY